MIKTRRRGENRIIWLVIRVFCPEEFLKKITQMKFWEFQSSQREIGLHSTVEYVSTETSLLSPALHVNPMVSQAYRRLPGSPIDLDTFSCSLRIA